MHILDLERRGATRSALRYRPLDPDVSGPVPMITRARRSRLDRLSTPAPAVPDVWEPEAENYPPRSRRAASTRVPRTSVPPVRVRHQVHPLWFIGLGLLVTVLLWIGVTQSIAWGTSTYDTLVYGMPRTFQIDAVVGHQDSPAHPSHFLALNLRGQITILEWPGGDPARVHTLVTSSALGPGGDQAVVTLRFVDLSHNTRPDMVIEVGGVQSVLVNDGTTFRLPTPAEQQQLLQELR